VPCLHIAVALTVVGVVVLVVPGVCSVLDRQVLGRDVGPGLPGGLVVWLTVVG